MKKYMKKAATFALVLIAGIANAQTEQPQMALGYTGEELPGSSNLGRNSEGLIKAAMKIDPNEYGQLSDLNILGFNVGVASRINIASLSVWATYSLDADPVVLFTSENAPVKGWNEVMLPSEIEINSIPFFIGYTIETSGASYPVASAGESLEDGLWLDTGNGWENFSDKDLGMLAMSVLVSSPDLPYYNLSLIKADIPPVLHSLTPTQIPIEVRNSGAMTVTGFSISCIEGDGPVQTFDFSSVLTPNERLKTELEILPLSAESEKPFEFTVMISAINEGEDSNPADNAISAMTRVSKYTFTKRAFIEEFTTMVCVNCPRAAGLLHQALALDDYKDKVMAVCHHSGYYTDYLTQPCDKEMLVLYGGEGSFAPAICYDRKLMEDGAVATSFPLVLTGLTDIFDQLLAEEALVDLNLKAEWNSSTSKLDITVEGGCSLETPPALANSITVYLLENNINTPNQAGGDANYMQQHVIRAYNATWGEEINWTNNGNFTYDVSLNVPDDINLENMEVVGVISHYDPQDLLNCEVFNCARAHFINWDGFAGVEHNFINEIHNVNYYEISGRKISSPKKGILIKETIYNDGSRHFEKILVK